MPKSCILEQVEEELASPYSHENCQSNAGGCSGAFFFTYPKLVHCWYCCMNV